MTIRASFHKMLSVGKRLMSLERVVPLVGGVILTVSFLAVLTLSSCTLGI